MKISAKPVDIVIRQVDMPTIDHNDEEIEKMYKEEERGQVNTNVRGRRKRPSEHHSEINSILGERSNRVVIPFGLYRINEEHKLVISFWGQHDLVVMKLKIKCTNGRAQETGNAARSITFL